eukprot:1207155-Pyramimonas_sp.AAC.1
MWTLRADVWTLRADVWTHVHAEPVPSSDGPRPSAWDRVDPTWRIYVRSINHGIHHGGWIDHEALRPRLSAPPPGGTQPRELLSSRHQGFR